jgi:tyrosinase
MGFSVRPPGLAGEWLARCSCGGHYAMGGDPDRDADNSPCDPGFWLHHGMIDRVWWIWQGLDLETRRYAISGTGTFLDQPASSNVTPETVFDTGHATDGPIAMGELMSTTMGPFCCVYV